MSDAGFRALIKARLTAMGAAVGRVHDYERWAAQPGQFLAHFQDPATKKIFGWEITRRKVRAQKIAMRRYKLVHRYLVRGYYGLEDAAATEKTFNALVDQIVLSFTLTKLPGSQGEQLPEAVIEPRIFGHVLCHVGEIILADVTEIVAVPEETAEDLTGIDIEYYLTPAPDELTDAEDNIDF
jgi:hypothetical protein